MEKLSKVLQPYKDLVGNVASIVTIGQFLSGAFVCKDIYNKGSTDGMSPNPFTGGVVIGLLMLEYSAILNDTAMFNVNIAAVIINLSYIAFYTNYTKHKSEVLKSLTIGGAIVGVCYGYTKLENPQNLEYRYGLLVTALMLVLIASPLFELRSIIDKKDASSLPFPIILAGTLVTFLWLLYGIILMNHFMIFQNTVGFTLSSVQLGLCFYYPGDKDKSD